MPPSFGLKCPAVGVGLLAFLLGSVAQANAPGPHWRYTGPHGAAHWAQLEPSFETCSQGQRQSPINIQPTVKESLPALAFAYSPIALNLTNNRHTVQVQAPLGSQLSVGGKSYSLVQLHFHTPSENTIQGRRYPMEVHWVHESAAGELAVVALMVQAGRHHAAFDPIFAHLPRPDEKITVESQSLDLAALLPSRRGYYAFDGSLTTPPCTEGVRWMVLQQPVQLSAKQIQAFRRLFPLNARPVQARHERTVRASL